jgi:NAD(P)-dependent dehydrogenase (short-subunit alcohol dehydrogenase family)
VTGYLARLFSLDGRVALVTGGSSGIGRGMAGALARAGARVVLLARGEDRLKETAAGLHAAGGTADWVSADLGDREAVAPFLLGQRFGPAMAARGWGRIINVTSQQSHRAFGHSGGYGASKAGLAALTRSQSEAWARHGVCCNAICPGFVATPLTAPVAGNPERSAALAARTMAGRNGEPADFEGAAVFLASPASDYITAQTLYVDGGFSAT